MTAGTDSSIDDAGIAPAFFEQTWDLSYRHALGKTVSRFFDGLKRRELLGRRCPDCERVLFPARSFCDRCHRETTEWLAVGHDGVVEMFTIVCEPFKGALADPPYVLAYVLLDGADTAALGYVRGVDLDDPASAAKRLARLKVSVQFVSDPQGRVTDFWFEPA